MRIEIPIKPLSINDAHKGRHIKTDEFLQFEKDVCYLLPINPLPVKDTEYFLRYSFYLKNYKNSDTGNFEKLITDLIVKRGYLKDDRYIKSMYLEKMSVKDKGQEKIILDIVPYEDRHKLLVGGTKNPPIGGFFAKWERSSIHLKRRLRILRAHKTDARQDELSECPVERYSSSDPDSEHHDEMHNAVGKCVETFSGSNVE